MVGLDDFRGLFQPMILCWSWTHLRLLGLPNPLVQLERECEMAGVSAQGGAGHWSSLADMGLMQLIDL